MLFPLIWSSGDPCDGTDRGDGLGDRSGNSDITASVFGMHIPECAQNHPEMLNKSLVPHIVQDVPESALEWRYDPPGRPQGKSHAREYMSFVRVLIPMFGGDISRRAMGEGMRKIVPQGRSWARQAEWRREAGTHRRFQTLQVADTSGRAR